MSLFPFFNTDDEEEQKKEDPFSPAVERAREELIKEEVLLENKIPNGLYSKNAAEEQSLERAHTEHVLNGIDWPMESEDISGGYAFIEGTKKSDYSLKYKYIEYPEDNISFEELQNDKSKETVTEISAEVIAEDNKLLKLIPDKNGIIHVNSETAPGIHFWANETIEIGGFILKNPYIYTVSDVDVILNQEYTSIPMKWLNTRLLLLSNIPNNLKSYPYDFEAIEQLYFKDDLLFLTLDKIAFYLAWLEKFTIENPKFKAHCYSRYIDSLWFRVFIEKKNLKEITLRFFKLAYYAAEGDYNNIREAKRALCAYFLCVKEGESFSAEEKAILADNFEKFFLHYHYKYKPGWDFDIIGLLSFLGHNYLPKSLMLLEYYGQYYSLWEQKEENKPFQYALTAVSYIIQNMKVSFKNAGEVRFMTTIRRGLYFTISYCGGIEFTADNKISPLAFIKQVMKGSNTMRRIGFYGNSLYYFSWLKEYDALFQNLPESIIKKTPIDTHPTMLRINKLLALPQISLLDVLSTFLMPDPDKSYILEYEGRRQELETLKKRLRQKKKQGEELTVEESFYTQNSVSLKTPFLLRWISQINEQKLKDYSYEIRVDNFDEAIALSNVQARIVDIYR